MNKKYLIEQLSEEELIKEFKRVQEECVITPFEKLEKKSYDTKNMRKLRTYSKNISLYVQHIQALRNRGFTLAEIMDL